MKVQIRCELRTPAIVNDGFPNDDRVATEAVSFGFDNGNECGDVRVEYPSAIRVEGFGMVECDAGREWTKAGVEVIEVWVDEFEWQALHAEQLSDPLVAVASDRVRYPAKRDSPQKSASPAPS